MRICDRNIVREIDRKLHANQTKTVKKASLKLKNWRNPNLLMGSYEMTYRDYENVNYSKRLVRSLGTIRRFTKILYLNTYPSTIYGTPATQIILTLHARAREPPVVPLSSHCSRMEL